MQREQESILREVSKVKLFKSPDMGEEKEKVEDRTEIPEPPQFGGAGPKSLSVSTASRTEEEGKEGR